MIIVAFACSLQHNGLTIDWRRSQCSACTSSKYCTSCIASKILDTYRHRSIHGEPEGARIICGSIIHRFSLVLFFPVTGLEHSNPISNPVFYSASVRQPIQTSSIRPADRFRTLLRQNARTALHPHFQYGAPSCIIICSSNEYESLITCSRFYNSLCPMKSESNLRSMCLMLCRQAADFYMPKARAIAHPQLESRTAEPAKRARLEVDVRILECIDPQHVGDGSGMSIFVNFILSDH